MTKAAVSISVFLVLLAFVTVVFAEERPSENPAVNQEKAAASERPHTKKADRKRLHGEVIHIDLSENMMIVKNKRGEFIFDIGTTRTGRGMKLEDIKPGDRIGIIYVEKDNKNVAVAMAKPPIRIRKHRKAAESNPGLTGMPAQHDTK